MKNKRIMWLINHTTLRQFEVPLLIDMGYEVFCPKSFPYNEGNLSASIEWKYDETLTIPEADLKILNETDFYNDVTEEVKILMNKYFDIAFFVAIREQINMVVNSFQGVLIFRTFGLAGESNYAENIIVSCGYATMLKIESIGKRFFFGYGYESMPKIEVDFMKNRGLYLPLGLKDAEFNGSWIGGDKRILFVCPRINTSPYFHEVYKKFKEDFHEFDYLIGGAQPIPVNNDSKVLGFIPREQYEYSMKNLSVMFYHSREKRHVHYHPFEAIKNGMPLIFMADGLLDSIGGKKLPGRCKTIAEAKKKIRRIMNGDQRFIRKVVNSQKVLLEVFKYDYCREQWEKAFEKVEESLTTIEKKVNSKRKIAIILPTKTTQEKLRKSKNIVKILKKAIDNNKENVELVFGYTDTLDGEDLSEITGIGVSVRKFRWISKSSEWVSNAMELKGYPFSFAYGSYCIPDDGITYFNDCDYILFTDFNIKNKLFLEKPYAFFITNLNQRYLDYDIYESEHVMIENMRYADRLFTYNITTMEDVIQYVGISKEKVSLIPEIIEQYSEKEVVLNMSKSPYFLWQTTAIHSTDIEKFLSILEVYYERGGSLNCVFSNDEGEMIDIRRKYDQDNADIIKLRNRIKQSSFLKKHLQFLKYHEMRDSHLIENAKFILNIDSLDEDVSSFLEHVYFNKKIVVAKSRNKLYYEKLMNMCFYYIDLDNRKAAVELLLSYENNLVTTYDEFPNITDSFIISDFWDGIHNLCN